MSGEQPEHLSAAKLRGQTLKGSYYLEERVAKGGMAWVYRAMHTSLKMPVAVKILFDEFSDESMISTRFVNEARIQFKLRHPHIVQVTDIIQERGVLGMVMEWIEGEDLQRWLRRHRQASLQDLWQIMAPVLEAMDYIHKQGMIHRDLKPANIMMQRFEDRVVPKIADFGIAKVMEGQEGQATKTGSHMGTLKYMSPEQIRDTKNVDSRADIYSLGTILYQLVAGQTPFRGEVHAIMYQQLEMKPQSPRDKRPDLPPAVEAVIMRCLAKKREERYPDCLALREALGDAIQSSLGQSLTQLPSLSAQQQGEAQVQALRQAAASYATAQTSIAPTSESGVPQASAVSSAALSSPLPSGVLSQIPVSSSVSVPDVSEAVTQFGQAAPSDLSRAEEQPHRSLPLLWLGLAFLLMLGAGFGLMRWLNEGPRPVVTPPDAGGIAQLRPKPLPERPDTRTIVKVPLPGRSTAAPLRVALTVQSRPAKAALYIDDKKVGSTPHTLYGKPGEAVAFRLRYRGRRSYKGKLLFGTQARTETLTLPKLSQPTPRRPVAFEVQSTPAGASIWRGGRRLGQTPKRFTQLPGSRLALVLKRENYQDQRVTLRFGRRAQRQNFRLSRLRASVTIKSNPSGAQLWYRGKKIGNTPYRMTGVAGKTLRFELRKERYATRQLRYTLKASGQQKSYTLKPAIDDPFK